MDQVEPEQTTPRAGWFADPGGRHQYRWWDGAAWTDAVASDGQVTSDPLGGPPPDADPDPDPAPAGARRGALVTIGLLVMLCVTAAVVVTRAGDGSDDRVAPVDAVSASTAQATATVDGTGGQVRMTVEAGRDAGVVLDVPAGALTAATTLTVDATPGPRGRLDDLVAEDPSMWWALAEYVIDAPNPVAHPVVGALTLPGVTEMTGPQLEFGPDGTEFLVPVEVTVPLDLLELEPGDVPIVLVEGALGWEIVVDTEVDHLDGVLRYSLTHFSRSIIGRILANVAANPTGTVSIDSYRAALDTLAEGPMDDVVDDVSRAILCRDDTAFRPADVPPLTDVLEYLGFASRRIGRAAPDAGQRIRDRLLAHHEQSRAGGDDAPHDIGFDLLLSWTMDETDGDPFQALVLAHDVLRDNQHSEPVQRVLADVRGDGGDERGARYHLLGTAVYSFAYEHQRVTGNTSWWTPSPETAVRIEEAWVSGDIATDTVEYAVDRAGAGLGRDLYHDYVARTSGQSADDLYLDCGDLPGGGPTSGGGPTTTTSTVPGDLQLGTGDVQVTLLWAGDADIDLHVFDPAGEEIYFGHARSTSGGQLDHDDVPVCGVETGDHAENVFWPDGSAPPGRYRAVANLFSSCGGAAAGAQLSITVDGRTVVVEAVTLTPDDRSAEFEFAVDGS